MAQSMASKEFVFEKLKEIYYEEIIVIAKKLDFKEHDIANKDTKLSIFKGDRSPTEMETPERYFENLDLTTKK